MNGRPEGSIHTTTQTEPVVNSRTTRLPSTSASTHYTHTSVFLFTKQDLAVLAALEPGSFSWARASCTLHDPLSLKFCSCCPQTFWSPDSFTLLKIVENSKEVFWRGLYLLIFTIFEIPTEKFERYFQLILK